MKTILTLIFGLYAIPGFSCDCKFEKSKPFKKEHYETAELIFTATIGEELKPGQFKIEITEILKGDASSIKTIINPDNHYCFKNVKQGDKWLIYSDLTQSEIFIDECSRSRNIEKEKELVPPPPPPRSKSKKSHREYQIVMDYYLKSDRGDINKELKQLRIIQGNAR
ncbi:MAG: hypothetical protein EBR30_11680 [Cytophagia bacterium]|nr:hypothetical protein [Cytophagia bacterium]